jgi:hypothetical protein
MRCPLSTQSGHRQAAGGDASSSHSVAAWRLHGQSWGAQQPGMPVIGFLWSASLNNEAGARGSHASFGTVWVQVSR